MYTLDDDIKRLMDSGIKVHKDDLQNWVAGVTQMWTGNRKLSVESKDLFSEATSLIDFGTMQIEKPHLLWYWCGLLSSPYSSWEIEFSLTKEGGRRYQPCIKIWIPRHKRYPLIPFGLRQEGDGQLRYYWWWTGLFGFLDVRSWISKTVENDLKNAILWGPLHRMTITDNTTGKKSVEYNIKDKFKEHLLTRLGNPSPIERVYFENGQQFSSPIIGVIPPQVVSIVQDTPSVRAEFSQAIRRQIATQQLYTPRIPDLLDAYRFLPFFQFTYMSKPWALIQPGIRATIEKCCHYQTVAESTRKQFCGFETEDDHIFDYIFLKSVGFEPNFSANGHAIPDFYHDTLPTCSKTNTFEDNAKIVKSKIAIFEKTGLYQRYELNAIITAIVNALYEQQVPRTSDHLLVLEKEFKEYLQ